MCVSNTRLVAPAITGSQCSRVRKQYASRCTILGGRIADLLDMPTSMPAKLGRRAAYLLAMPASMPAILGRRVADLQAMPASMPAKLGRRVADLLATLASMPAIVVDLQAMPASTLAILGRRVADLLAMPASLGRCVASRWWQRLACVRACVCRPATCRARSGSGSRVSSHHRRPALLGVAAACVCPRMCRTRRARGGSGLRVSTGDLPCQGWQRLACVLASPATCPARGGSGLRVSSRVSHHACQAWPACM